MRLLRSIYGVMSTVTLIAYAVDKRAAVRGRWRIAERTLHVLEFSCGWPGAFIGQQEISDSPSEGLQKVGIDFVNGTIV